MAAAIVVGVVIVALGRGGEMAKSTADFVPFGPGDITATDVALLRPPPSLYGYHIPATDQALSRIAQTMTERDVQIATLRRQLAELRSIAAADAGLGLRASADSGVPGAPGVAGEPGVPGTLRGPAVAGAPGGLFPPRPSVWRRELTDPEPAQDPHPAPGAYRAQQPYPAPGRPPAQDPPRAQDPWPPQDPWSAWERQSGLAAGPAADEPVAGPADEPVTGPSGEPAARPAVRPAAGPGPEPDGPAQQAASNQAPDPFEDTDPGTSRMTW
jgi:hypothetical protein